VTGLDFSSKMVLQLKTRKEDLKSDLKIINADAHRLPFKDNSFDVVVCRFAVWSLHDPQQAIAEMARVTKREIIIYTLYHNKQRGGNESHKRDPCLNLNRMKLYFSYTIKKARGENGDARPRWR
jgi:ubiquinone/menaquinone biosynthesis C-methylase UbiE